VEHYSVDRAKGLAVGVRALRGTTGAVLELVAPEDAAMSVLGVWGFPAKKCYLNRVIRGK
jgi:hypothetical protein